LLIVQSERRGGRGEGWEARHFKQGKGVQRGPGFGKNNP